MKLIFTFLLGTFYLIFVPNTRGDIGIAPQLKELNISCGGWDSFNLIITNRGSGTASLEMNAFDMDLSEDGMPIEAEEGYERGCADWLTFNPEYFSLEPGEFQNVKVIVKATKDAVGSYFAIMSCKYTTKQVIGAPSGEKGSTGFEFSMRVASVLLLTLNSSKNYTSLQPDTVKLYSGSSSNLGPLANTNKATQKNWEIEIPVTNEGNVYTIVDGEASIYTEAGKIVARAPLVAGKGFVFPNRCRVFKATGDRPLPDGAYLVRANIRSKDGRSRSGSFPFTVVGGVAIAGSESEEINTLVRASLPGFSLQKQYIDIEIQPGSHRTKGTIIESHAEDTLNITTRMLNWTVDESGNINILKKEESYNLRSCASWLTASPNPLVLLPGRRKSIKLHVQAPDEIDGEYYAAVIFDPEGIKGELPSEFELPRALFVSASDKRSAHSSAEIKSVVSKQANREVCVFEVEFKNTGNVHCFASGHMNLLSQKGDRMRDRVDFGGTGEFILPGGIRTFVIPWQGELLPGKYSANFTIDYYESGDPVQESISFKIE